MKKTVKKRAFVSAIAMLIVSAIALTSSTFAWFSMSKKATVEQMDLTVSSPEGILVSANAKAWTSTLTVDQLFPEANSNDRMNAYDGNKNFLPAELKPVSTNFRRNTNGYYTFYYGALNDRGTANVVTLDQNTITADAAGFVAFDLFIKLAENKRVYFSDSTFVDNAGQKSETALRVAFQQMQTFPLSTSADTIASTVTAGTVKMYEVDAYNRSDDALASGKAPGKVTTTYLDYTGSMTVNADYVFTSGTETHATLITNDQAKDAKSLTLNAGITKIRIYIWIEGNDIDCRNSIGGSTISANFAFTID